MAESFDDELNNLREVQSTNSSKSQTGNNPKRPPPSSQNLRSSRRSRTNGSTRAQHPNLHNALPRRPQYSLAGNVTQAHGPSFVDPRYHEMNPRYQRVENLPVWGLAKPLPRVVRPRMRRGRDGGLVEDTGAEREAPGSAEQIPQLGMIDDQRQEAGKHVKDGSSTEGRGYGHEHERVERRTSKRTIPRAASEDKAGNRCETPKDEINNPMEAWSRGSSYGRSHTDPLDNQNAELGDRRLSQVQEIPSQSGSFNGPVSETSDPDEVDLEAGDKMDEWALEEEEAETYAQEAYDNHNLWSSIRAKFREPFAECLAVSFPSSLKISPSKLMSSRQ